MVEAMYATEGQLPPEKQAQLLERIADNALERRLRELAPMVEAVQATEGQLPPEKTELLLKQIAEGAAKRRLYCPVNPEEVMRVIRIDDMCIHISQAGVWFEGGELSKFLNRLKAGGDLFSGFGRDDLTRPTLEAIDAMRKKMGRRTEFEESKKNQVKDSVEAAFDAYHQAPQSMTMRCSACLVRFQLEDVKSVATHPSLKGDPLLGQEAFLRFIPDAGNMMPDGKIKDAKGSVCTQTACPECHQILSYESVSALTENPYAPA